MAGKSEDEIYASLRADAEQWKRGMREAETSVDKLDRAVGRSMQGIGRGLEAGERSVKRFGRNISDVRGVLTLFGNVGGDLGKSLGGLSLVVGGVADAVSLLGITVMRSPLGLLAIAASAAGAAYMYLNDKVDTAKTLQDAYNESMEGMKKVTGEGKGYLDDLTKAYKDLTAAQRESERIDILGAIRQQEKVIEAAKGEAGDKVPSFLGNLMMDHEKGANYPLMVRARDNFAQSGDIDQLKADLFAAGYREQAFAIGEAGDKAAAAAKAIERLNMQMKLLNGEKTPEVINALAKPETGKSQAEEFADLLERLNKEGAAMTEARRKAAENVVTTTRTPQEKYDEGVAALDAMRSEFPDMITEDVYQRQVSNLKTEMEKADDATKAWKDTVKDLGLTFESAFEDALVNIDNWRGALSGLLQDIQRLMIRKAITEPLMGAASSFFTGLLGGSEGSTQMAFLPGRATGGPVTSQTPYMVGERGPELFVPHASGTIMQNGKTGAPGGGVTVVQHINFSGGVRPDVQAEVARLMPAVAKAAENAVINARQRGGQMARAFQG